jgi:hypothetical protein
MKGIHRCLAVGAGLLAALPCAAQGLALKASDATLKFGFLFQPQYEAAGNPTLDGTSQNLFMRRMRLYMVGSYGDKGGFGLIPTAPIWGRAIPTAAASA